MESRNLPALYGSSFRGSPDAFQDNFNYYFCDSRKQFSIHPGWMPFFWTLTMILFFSTAEKRLNFSGFTLQKLQEMQDTFLRETQEDSGLVPFKWIESVSAMQFTSEARNRHLCFGMCKFIYHWKKKNVRKMFVISRLGRYQIFSLRNYWSWDEPPGRQRRKASIIAQNCAVYPNVRNIIIFPSKRHSIDEGVLDSLKCDAQTIKTNLLDGIGMLTKSWQQMPRTAKKQMGLKTPSLDNEDEQTSSRGSSQRGFFVFWKV